MTSISNVALHVEDLARSEAFYTEVLGLTVVARIEAPAVREVIVAAADGSGSQLMLAQQREATARAEPAGIWKVYVDTDDLVALYDRVIAAGAELVTEPKHLEQWHVTIALVKDPDGYLLELGQRHLT